MMKTKPEMTKRKTPDTEEKANPQAVRRVLRKVFGLRRLRPGQYEVIARILEGRSTLARASHFATSCRR
jgi:superfamily II DNA helicase RecQ